MTAGAPSASGYVLTLNSGGKSDRHGRLDCRSRKTLQMIPAAGWWPTMHGGARLELEHMISAGRAGAPGIENRRHGYGPVGGSECIFRLHGGEVVCASARPVPAEFSRQGSQRGDGRICDWRNHDARARWTAGSRVAPVCRHGRAFDARMGRIQRGVHGERDGVARSAVETGFNVSGGSVLLSDVSLEQVGGDAANHTAFRDEVVETLKELHPGVLRLMEERRRTGQHGGESSEQPCGARAVGLPRVVQTLRQRCGGDSGVS